jgi:hypothetical protein
MSGFATIKASAWLQPCRGVVQLYRSNRSNAIATSNTTLLSSRIRKSTSTKHLLVVKSTGSPKGLSVVFVSRRKIVPASTVDDVQPYEKASLVYMEGR